ncbi:MAG TPA: carbohydrate binding family 9 domain-containing protein, partial [Gemmatimonadales bacterium]
MLSGISIPLASIMLAALQNPLPTQSRDTLRAGGAHAHAREIRAAQLEGSVEVDGHLNEPGWARAEPASGFTQTDPIEGQPATESTEVRVLIGADALYIGARLYDREARRVKAVLARRDDDVESDELDVYLDTFHDHLSGVRFRITPGGAILDGILGSSAQGSDEDDSWDPVWESAARVDSLGWTAELRIPLSQLRYNSTANGVWGIQLYRKILRKGEEDWFSFVPKSEFGGVSRYAHLVNLGKLRPQRRVELAPYLLARAAYQPTVVGDPYRSGHDYNG